MNTQLYEINEVVWAKVIGYPWWPAQIASCMSHKYRVNFIGDVSHADLRFEQIKKWAARPLQQESKKLRAAIEIADSIQNGESTEQSIESLNEHCLKNIVIKLHNAKSEEVDILNSISPSELLAIVKLNFGQQLFQIHQMIKNNKDYKQQLRIFVDSLIGAIGYQKKRLRPMYELDEITKCVILQNDIKKKKTDDSQANQ